MLDLGILPDAGDAENQHWWDVSVIGITKNRRTVPTHILYPTNSQGEHHPVPGYEVIQAGHAFIADCLKQLSSGGLAEGICRGFEDSLRVLKECQPILPAAGSRQHFRYIHRGTSRYIRKLLRMTDPQCCNDVFLLVKEVSVTAK